ncbi:hypothetical protein D3C72_2564890 [compost metagenome]
MSAMSWPSMRIWPEVGSTSLLIIRISVVLPEPDVPTMTQMLRGSMVRVTRSTTTVPL